VARRRGVLGSGRGIRGDKSVGERKKTTSKKGKAFLLGRENNNSPEGEKQHGAEAKTRGRGAGGKGSRPGKG